MRRCELCKDGIRRRDGAGAEYVECVLTPPRPVLKQSVVDGKIVDEILWLRPPMALKGWCGQFKLSVFKLLRHGRSRA